MEMESLAEYFGLGEQTHRSLNDIHMNIEVLGHFSTVLLLEYSLPDVLIQNSRVAQQYPTVSLQGRHGLLFENHLGPFGSHSKDWSNVRRAKEATNEYLFDSLPTIEPWKPSSLAQQQMNSNNHALRQLAHMTMKLKKGLRFL